MSNFFRPNRSLFIRPQSQVQTSQEMANYVPYSRQGSFSTISSRMIQYLKNWVGKIIHRQSRQNSAQLIISKNPNPQSQPIDESKIFKDINIRSHIIQEQDYVLKPQPKQFDSDYPQRRLGRISFKAYLKDEQKETEIKSAQQNLKKDIPLTQKLNVIDQKKQPFIPDVQKEVVKIPDGRIFKKQKLNGKRSSLNLILRSKKQYFRQSQKQLEKDEVIDFGVVQVQRENLNDLSISESSEDEELQSAIPKFNNDVILQKKNQIQKEKEQLSLIEDCQMFEQEVQRKRQSLNNSFSSRVLSDFPSQKAQFIWKGMQSTPKSSNEDQKQISEFFKAPVKEIKIKTSPKKQEIIDIQQSPKSSEKKSQKVLTSHSLQVLLGTQEKKLSPPLITLEPTQQKKPQSPISKENTQRKQAIDIGTSHLQTATQNSQKMAFPLFGNLDEKQPSKIIEQDKHNQPLNIVEIPLADPVKLGITKSESYQSDLNKGDQENLDKNKVQKEEDKKPNIPSLFSNLSKPSGTEGLFNIQNKPQSIFGDLLKQTEQSLFKNSTQAPAVGLFTPLIPSKLQSQKDESILKLDDSKPQSQEKPSMFGSLLDLNRKQEQKPSLFFQVQDQTQMNQTETNQEVKVKANPQNNGDQDLQQNSVYNPPIININDQKYDPKLETPQKPQIENPFMKASPIIDQKRNIAQIYSAPPSKKFNEQGQEPNVIQVPQTFPQAKTDIFSQQNNLLPQNQTNPFTLAEQSPFTISFQQSQPSQFQQLFTPVPPSTNQPLFFNQQQQQPYQNLNTSYSQSQEQSMDIDEPNSSQQMIVNQAPPGQFLFPTNQQSLSLFGFGAQQPSGGELLFQQPQISSQQSLFAPMKQDNPSKKSGSSYNRKNQKERIPG